MGIYLLFLFQTRGREAEGTDPFTSPGLYGFKSRVLSQFQTLVSPIALTDWFHAVTNVMIFEWRGKQHPLPSP
jgi:hypothetical protein